MGSTVLPPPFIDVPYVANFRSVNAPGVQSMLLFRSAELSKLTTDGISQMRELGIATIFDLRSEPEILEEGTPDVEWEEATRIPVQIFKDDDFSLATVVDIYREYSYDSIEAIVKTNQLILEAGARDAYRQILKHLASEEPLKPVLIHCGAGKDRTGLIIAMILALCSVPDEIIAQEYGLTEQGLGDMRSVIIERLRNRPGWKGTDQEIEHAIGAKSSRIMATLPFIRETYGGPEGYAIKYCGLTKEEVYRIKKNLTIGSDSSVKL